MYGSYVFDFDYTLANSEKGIVMCFEMLFAAEGYPPIPRDIICQTIGMPMFDAMQQLTQEKDPQKVQALIYRYKVNYSDKYMTKYTYLYADTKSTLQGLKNKGANCYILSSKTRSRIYETLTKEHMTSLIDGVIGSEDVQHLKPSPEGMSALCSIYGCQKKDMLYIGDNVIDAQTANTYGCDFAAVTTGTTPATAFYQFPHIKIMNHLHELLSIKKGKV